MPKQRLPTTAEISAKAGVSKSTVSRALKNDQRISGKTRARVMSIAENLGYAPNAIAQSLATQQSRIIGFIGSEEENYWYQENIQRLAKVIGESGRQMMLFQVRNGGDVLDVVPEMIPYRLAGCIIIPTVKISPQAIESLERYRTPVVLLNRLMRNTQACSVQCDQESGAYSLAQLLIASGHERIAMIAGPATPTAIGREKGFLAGLAAGDRKLFARATGNFVFIDAYRAASELFARKVKPDAVFAANDLMAFGVIDAARDKGIRVPQDMSIVGFDNSRIGEWPGYSLTTVAQPIEQMFRRAIDLINARSEAPSGRPESVVMDGELVIRHSTRLPQQWPDLRIAVARQPKSQ